MRADLSGKPIRSEPAHSVRGSLVEIFHENSRNAFLMSFIKVYMVCDDKCNV